MASCVHRQEFAQPVQEERMPIDTGQRRYVGKDVKAAPYDIRLSHPFADAKRTNVAALEICPLVQSLTSFAQNGFSTLLVQFLEDDIAVSGPLVFETIFVFLQFTRNQKMFTSPGGALLIRTVVIQNRIADARRR